MNKQNLQPQQQKPVTRPVLAKPNLCEQQSTASLSGICEAIAPAKFHVKYW